MTPRLYFDEDSLDQALIRALKARGLDVESALTAGMGRRSDRDQLAYATEQGRVLYGYNVGDSAASIVTGWPLAASTRG